MSPGTCPGLQLPPALPQNPGGRHRSRTVGEGRNLELQLQNPEDQDGETPRTWGKMEASDPRTAPPGPSIGQNHSARKRRSYPMIGHKPKPIRAAEKQARPAAGLLELFSLPSEGEVGPTPENPPAGSGSAAGRRVLEVGLDRSERAARGDWCSCRCVSSGGHKAPSFQHSRSRPGGRGLLAPQGPAAGGPVPLGSAGAAGVAAPGHGSASRADTDPASRLLRGGL